MALDKDVIKLIEQRSSVRSYDSRPIEPDKLSAFEAFLTQAVNNPFDAKVRFSMLGMQDEKIPGTYGFIKGAKAFFGGCVQKGGHDLEGFGYAFEKAVLFATSLKLGTCWLGGTFKRTAANAILKPKDEYLPAISPLGYAASKKSWTEKAVARGANAKTRKPFGELFFEKNFCTPMVANDDLLTTCLQMVRIGPSASNRQPWRMIRNNDGCHFFMQCSKRYAGNTLYGFCMQRLDLGIAACHFELTAKQKGLSGAIVIDDPDLLTEDQKEQGLRYSFTWR